MRQHITKVAGNSSSRALQPERQISTLSIGTAGSACREQCSKLNTQSAQATLIRGYHARTVGCGEYVHGHLVGQTPASDERRYRIWPRSRLGYWANASSLADAQVVSEGLPAFQVLRTKINSHRVIVTGSGRALAEHPEFQWVNILLGNLKNAMTGTYHASKFAKFAPRYLADFQYRFKSALQPAITLTKTVAGRSYDSTLTERQLTSAELGT